jgi:hypothetical protein
LAKFDSPSISILTADGKLAGPVLIHIRRTKAFRKAYPAKKPTKAQARAIRAFTVVDAAWQRLTRAQKDAWNVWRYWEKNFGYNRYQRINIPRRLAGLPLLSSPPIVI